MLSTRAETILNAIVRHYITEATPVPSQGLSNEYGLMVSTATIRNEMAHLEDNGYIIRPHTSAGSIPSDKGYRYYVETLQDFELPLADQRLISHVFHQAEGELEGWLNLAATLIAQLVHGIAMVAKLKPESCRFKHLQLVPLQDTLALAVLVLHGAKVKQQLVTFNQAISQSKLTAIAGKLNKVYSGLTHTKIMAKEVELTENEQQVNDCLLKMMEIEDKREYEEPYLDGLHFMLNQPEFAQSHRLLNLMELVEQRSLLRTVTPPRLTDHGVQVVIGKENESEAIHDCSVVIGRYGLPEEAIGTIGVIGPTRMPYARAIATIDYLSSLLSKLVAELYGQKNLGSLNSGKRQPSERQ